MEEYFGHLLVRAIDYVCRFQHTGMVHLSSCYASKQIPVVTLIEEVA